MTDIVAAAAALQPLLRARSAEIEQARRLPPDISAMLARAGLFRMATPKEIGGLELPPSDIFRAIETVREADASAGWCVMIGTTSGMTAAWLPPQIAQPIFGPPDVVTCGVFAPMGRAVEDGDDVGEESGGPDDPGTHAEPFVEWFCLNVLLHGRAPWGWWANSCRVNSLTAGCYELAVIALACCSPSGLIYKCADNDHNLARGE